VFDAVVGMVITGGPSWPARLSGLVDRKGCGIILGP
jgi:hypothetical protein